MASACRGPMRSALPKPMPGSPEPVKGIGAGEIGRRNRRQPPERREAPAGAATLAGANEAAGLGLSTFIRTSSREIG